MAVERKAGVFIPPRAWPDWRGLVGLDGPMALWRTLATQNRLPSVMLLIGRDGMGKRGLLSFHGALVACDKRSACGLCMGCRQVLMGVHPDLLFLDEDENEKGSGKIPIAEAARLQEFLSLAAGGAAARLGLVADADRLTPQAANRLLKTLEEPLPGARVVLTTSRVKAVLPTIRSRCVPWRLPPPPAALILSWLRDKLTKAGVSVPDDTVLSGWLKLSGHAPGRLLALSGLTDDTPKLSNDQTLGALARLLGPDGAGDDVEGALAAATLLGRDLKWGAEPVLGAAEVVLNGIYATGRGRASPGRIHVRRRLLRQARQLGVFGSIAINTQLLCESLAFCGAEEN